MQLAARLMQSQQVNTVNEYLSSLQQPVWTDDERCGLPFAIKQAASADSDARFALAILDAAPAGKGTHFFGPGWFASAQEGWLRWSFRTIPARLWQLS